MVKLFHAVLTGLVGAAFLHLVIILALPSFVKADAYHRVLALGEPGRFYRLAEKVDATPLRGLASDTGVVDRPPPPLSSEDPFLSLSACAISVADGPVRLYAEGDVPLWTVGIFDRKSNEIYSMSDRTSVSGALDILAGTPAQLTMMRKALPEELSQTILVEVPEDGGYAVLRAFAPAASFRAGVADFLAEAECGAFKPGAAPETSGNPAINPANTTDGNRQEGSHPAAASGAEGHPAAIARPVNPA